MTYDMIDQIWAEWFQRPRSQLEDQVLDLRLATGVNRDEALAELLAIA